MVKSFKIFSKAFLLTLIIIVGICSSAKAQTLIGHQDFDGTVTLGAVIGGVNGTIVTGSSAAGDRPASSTFYSSVNTAASVTNGSGTVTTSDVTGLAAYTGKYFEFRLASWSIGSTGNGADGADIVTVAISTDGGTVYSNEMTIAGNANAYWHYSTGTGVATVTYDGNNTPTAFAPAGGANRTTDGYSTIRVNLPDAGTQARLRITLFNNAAAERWTVDDIKIFGIPSSSPSLSVSTATLTGFTYVVGSGPSTSQTYNLSGTNLTGAPGNIAVTGSTNYEVSTDNTNFFASVNVAYASATLASTPVYVRLKSGLSVNTYNSEAVTNAGGGATTQTVTCSGSVTGSNLSDIITANGESATISSIINTAGPLTSVQGTQVWQFTVRDGGASSPDADNLSTIVNSITFSQAAGDAVGDWTTAIQAIDLFDGVTNVGSGVVTANQVAFTGLNINVADNSTKTISVRLTLKCGLGTGNNDGDDFGFQISNGNVTFNAAGSGKIAFAAISTTNGQNAIAVVATHLAFSQQPSSTGTGSNMSPSVTVTGTDVCGNTDLGFTAAVSLTSTGTMTGTPLGVNAVAGIATFSGVIHTVVGTGLTLSASSTGLTGATSSTFDIYVATTFEGGDMAIVGMCVNQGACGGGAGDDEISLVSFLDIVPGTSFFMTDNGYQRVGCASGAWGDGEGVVQITRTTSTLPAGTVFTFRIRDNAVFTPLGTDGNWTIAYTVNTAFNLNGNDEQVYLMQGGTWTNPGGASDATYANGNFMFAINTFTSWTCNDNSTQRGDLPAQMKCFNILAPSGFENVKYTGPLTPASQRDWIDRLNNQVNWTAMDGCAGYNAQMPDYASGATFVISAGGFNSGYWTGATNTDWFDCNNWQNFKVPDSLANVTIDNVANDPIIGASPVLYPNGAICNDLLITNTSGAGILTLNNALSYLSIKGSVTNNGTITGTLGNVEFRSAVAQTFGGSGSTSIYRMYLKNSHASGLSLTQDITVTDLFTFTTGILSTGTNKLIVTNTSNTAIAGYGSTKFINGNLRQSIASNALTYTFPMGYSIASTDYHPARFINGNIVGPTYLDVSVSSITEAGNNIDSRIAATQSGVGLTDVVNTAEWTITPSAAATAGTYGVDLYVTNIAGLTDDQFFVVKRDNASTDYADWSTFDATTFIPVAGSAGRITSAGAGFATRVNYSTFSKFAIAKGPPVFILPIELVGFTGKKVSKSIVLNWETASEVNLSHYEIQKSGDAVSYNVLGTVNASVDGRGAAYQLIDENPVNGINYYKLFSVDKDGKRDFQKTISVNYLNDVKEDYIISYTDDKVLVSLKEVSKQTEVGVYSLTGQLIKEFSYEELMNGVLILNNSDFTKGMYILRVGQGFTSSSDKIIIR